MDIIESLQVLNILLLQKCRNYYCSCFKEKQFAVELWLLLSVLSFYRKAWGLKINLSSTSRPGLSKLLSLLNESSENLTLKVTQGAGVHSNHFWEIWPSCTSWRALHVWCILNQCWEQTLSCIVIIWNQKLVFTLSTVYFELFHGLCMSIDWLISLQLCYRYFMLLNRGLEWAATLYWMNTGKSEEEVSNCRISRQNNTVNDSLCCDRTSTPLSTADG